MTISEISLASLSAFIADINPVIEVHPVPVVTYTPNDHMLCGELAYRGTYDGIFIEDSVDPVAYDSSNR